MNKYEKLLSLPVNFTIESSDAGEQLAYQRGVKDAFKLISEDLISIGDAMILKDTLKSLNLKD